MNILIIAQFFPPDMGGATRAYKALAKVVISLKENSELTRMMGETEENTWKLKHPLRP